MNDEFRMRELVTAYRRSIAPHVGDRARLWLRLQSAPAPSRSQRPALAIAMFVALAAAIVVAIVSLAPRLAALRTSAADQAEFDAAGRGGDDARVRDAARREPSAVATASEREVLPARPSVATPPSAMPPAAMPTEAKTPRRPRTSKPMSAEDSLRAELHAIETARAALDRGDAAAAIAATARHLRRFPDGQLALEARALHAIALCRAGQTTRGHAEAAALLRLGSPYDARLRDACGL